MWKKLGAFEKNSDGGDGAVKRKYGAKTRSV
jgi:hypothetical protein